MSGEVGIRHTQGKLKLSDIFYWLEPEFLMDMVKVMEFGGKKYAKDNWKKGLPVNDCLDSAIRHLVQVRNGVLKDQEPKEKFGLEPTEHLAHAAINCMFAWYFAGEDCKNPDGN